jgi:hypothetical protein
VAHSGVLALAPETLPFNWPSDFRLTEFEVLSSVFKVKPRVEIPKLFKTGETQKNVVLNFSGRPKHELGIQSEAYHRSARVLVESFAGHGGYNDFDGCPIVYLYRHSLELAIKALLILGNQIALLLQNEELGTDESRLFRDHALAIHLPKLKLIFEAVGWPDAFDQIGFGSGEVEQIIQEFDQYDPHSFAFRYPIKKDGSASLPEHFVFDPLQFSRTLDPILTSLLGGCTGLEVFIDALHEARAYEEAEAQEGFASDFYDDSFFYSE